jgi:hypothetical protein
MYCYNVATGVTFFGRRPVTNLRMMTRMTIGRPRRKTRIRRRRREEGARKRRSDSGKKRKRNGKRRRRRMRRRKKDVSGNYRIKFRWPMRRPRSFG